MTAQRLPQIIALVSWPISADMLLRHDWNNHDNIKDDFNNDPKDKKEVNMVTVASIDELGSPSGDGAGGGEDNLGHISSICCGHHCQQNNENHYLSNVKVL